MVYGHQNGVSAKDPISLEVAADSLEDAAEPPPVVRPTNTATQSRTCQYIRVTAAVLLITAVAIAAYILTRSGGTVSTYSRGEKPPNSYDEMRIHLATLNLTKCQKAFDDQFENGVGPTIRSISMADVTNNNSQFERFDKADKGKNGHLDAHELLSVFQGEDMDASLQQAKSVLQHHDADSDGLLSFSEWAAMINGPVSQVFMDITFFGDLDMSANKTTQKLMGGLAKCTQTDPSYVHMATGPPNGLPAGVSRVAFLLPSPSRCCSKLSNFLTRWIGCPRLFGRPQRVSDGGGNDFYCCPASFSRAMESPNAPCSSATNPAAPLYLKVLVGRGTCLKARIHVLP
jgi:hypothetical protein